MAQEQPSLSEVVKRLDRQDERLDRIEATLQELQELMQPTDDETKIQEVLDLLQGLGQRAENHEERLDRAIQLLEEKKSQLKRMERGKAGNPA